MTSVAGRRLRPALAAALLVLSACSSLSGSDTSTAITYFAPQDVAPPYPDLDQKQVAAGEELYKEQCASCHKADLSGEPNWKTPKADGTYPPPPQDSTGHTWHHPDQLLLQIVREGLDITGTTMPTFGDKLTDSEIISILEYLKSSWGPEQRAAQWQVTWQESQ